MDKVTTGFDRSMALVAMDLNYAGIFEVPKFLILLVTDGGRDNKGRREEEDPGRRPPRFRR